MRLNIILFFQLEEPSFWIANVMHLLIYMQWTC